jgi:hypothetical protein
MLMGLVRAYRVVYVAGRYGSGKTALAVRLAYELLESGFATRCVANFPVVFADDWEQLNIEDPYASNTVVILDEGGLFLETRGDTKELLAFLRKMNITLIIPSVHPPANRIRAVTIQRLINLQALGLPAWLYSVYLASGHIKEESKFLWWRPSEIFGTYDTLSAPVDDDGIGEWLVSLKERIRSVSRKTRKQIGGQFEDSVLAGTAAAVGGNLSAGSAQADAILEAADVMADAAALISASQGKTRRRRGFIS